MTADSDTSASASPEGPDRAVLRLLDANLNRAFEGLRVVEDYVRFVLQDGLLQQRYKALRHELRQASRQLPAAELVGSRDAAEDVGAKVGTASEYSRQDAKDVAQANAKRLEQSLRALEEFSKLLVPEAARHFERCRYLAYELARQLSRLDQVRTAIPEVCLYVLITGGKQLDECLRLADGLIRAGVGFLQLRDKRLPDRELLERGRALARLCRGTSTHLIINDRPDLARLCDAAGVHVGQDELPVSDVREIVGPRRLIGVSTRRLDQFERAVEAGADYVGCGPTFPSQTKTFPEFAGTNYLYQVIRRTAWPAFAIGGITLDNLSEVLETGFRRIAVGHAITSEADPGAAAREFVKRMSD